MSLLDFALYECLIASIFTMIYTPIRFYLTARNKDIPKDRLKAWVKKELDSNDGQAEIVLTFVAGIAWPITLFALLCIVAHRTVTKAWVYAIHYFYPGEPAKTQEKKAYR